MPDYSSNFKVKDTRQFPQKITSILEYLDLVLECRYLKFSLSSMQL